MLFNIIFILFGWVFVSTANAQCDVGILNTSVGEYFQLNQSWENNLQTSIGRVVANKKDPTKPGWSHIIKVGTTTGADTLSLVKGPSATIKGMGQEVTVPLMGSVTMYSWANGTITAKVELRSSYMLPTDGGNSILGEVSSYWSNYSYSVDTNKSITQITRSGGVEAHISETEENIGKYRGNRRFDINAILHDTEHLISLKFWEGATSTPKANTLEREDHVRRELCEQWFDKDSRESGRVGWVENIIVTLKRGDPSDNEMTIQTRDKVFRRWWGHPLPVSIERTLDTKNYKLNSGNEKVYYSDKEKYWLDEWHWQDLKNPVRPFGRDPLFKSKAKTVATTRTHTNYEDGEYQQHQLIEDIYTDILEFANDKENLTTLDVDLHEFKTSDERFHKETISASAVEFQNGKPAFYLSAFNMGTEGYVNQEGLKINNSDHFTGEVYQISPTDLATRKKLLGVQRNIIRDNNNVVQKLEGSLESLGRSGLVTKLLKIFYSFGEPTSYSPDGEAGPALEADLRKKEADILKRLRLVSAPDISKEK